MLVTLWGYRVKQEQNNFTQMDYREYNPTSECRIYIYIIFVIKFDGLFVAKLTMTRALSCTQTFHGQAFVTF